MTLREWLGSIALLEIILICIAIRTGWRWYRAEPIRRLLRALRAQWKRVLAGAVAGWLLSSVLGLTLILGAYDLLGDDRSFYGSEFEDRFGDFVSIVFPLAGVGLGALLAYSTRKEPLTE